MTIETIISNPEKCYQIARTAELLREKVKITRQKVDALWSSLYTAESNTKKQKQYYGHWSKWVRKRKRIKTLINVLTLQLPLELKEKAACTVLDNTVTSSQKESV